MRLILMGCEYAGTTTLSRQIIKWVKENLGDDFGFHDHWKLPHVSHPTIPGPSSGPYGSKKGEVSPAFTIEDMWEAWESGNGPDPTMTGHTDEENNQFLALSPKIKESFQRYHMEYHMGFLQYAKYLQVRRDNLQVRLQRILQNFHRFLKVFQLHYLLHLNYKFQNLFY